MMPNLKTFHNIRCLLVDLDDTLYPHTNGVWEMIRIRINQFLSEKMGFPAEKVPELRYRLWSQYGTTLRGLQVEYAVDMDDFLDFVHDVPLEKILSPDPELDSIFQNIPQRKVIFTNAHAAHARRVINLLGISRHFETIVDIYAMTPHCKPDVEAFQKTLDIIREKPEDCVLIDDAPKNLETALSLSMGAISVGKHQHDSCPHIETIHDLLPKFHH